MGFLDPKRHQEDDELPGSGLHLDLDVRTCPACRREAMPWEETCPTCGVATVTTDEMPPQGFPLPHLADDEGDASAEDPADGSGPGAA